MRKLRFKNATHAAPSQSFGGWAVLGLLLGCATAALAFAPASVLAWAIQDQSHGRLQLLDARGTVWAGNGQLVFSGGAGSQSAMQLPGSVSWTNALGWGAGLVVWRSQWHMSCCSVEPLRAVVSPNWSGFEVQVQSSQSRWPANLLAGLGTPWNTVGLQGELKAQINALKIARLGQSLSIDGQVQIQMINAASSMSTLKPLGSYELNISGGAAPSLQLRTLDGALQLQGNGQWVGGRLRFTGEAQARSVEHESALSNLLNIIGRRDGVKSIINLG
jgi:general secretion pathway protein N